MGFLENWAKLKKPPVSWIKMPVIKSGQFHPFLWPFPNFFSEKRLPIFTYNFSNLLVIINKVEF
jgi:hypothetical protein